MSENIFLLLFAAQSNNLILFLSLFRSLYPCPMIKLRWILNEHIQLQRKLSLSFSTGDLLGRNNNTRKLFYWENFSVQMFTIWMYSVTLIRLRAENNVNYLIRFFKKTAILLDSKKCQMSLRSILLWLFLRPCECPHWLGRY